MPSTIDLNALSVGVPPPNLTPAEITPPDTSIQPTQPAPIAQPASIAQPTQPTQPIQPIQPTQPTIITVPQYIQQPIQTATSPNINVTINDREEGGSIRIEQPKPQRNFPLLSLLNGLCLISIGLIIFLEQTGILEIHYYNLDIVQIGALLTICCGFIIMLTTSWAVRLL